MPTFQKSERLCSYSVIDSLFSSGKSFTVFPYRVVWKTVDLETKFPAQVTFSVSKRNHKKAVTRNYIRRLMREAYRDRKESFYEILGEKNIKVAMMIIYVDKNIPTLPFTHDKIKAIFERFKKEYKVGIENKNKTDLALDTPNNG